MSQDPGSNRQSKQDSGPDASLVDGSPIETQARIEAQAMQWLARREYSVHELARRLSDKGFASDDISKAVEGLIGQGLVSDSRFTETLIRIRMERGYGPLKIAHELRSKGIEDGLIEELLPGEDEAWVERLRAVWQKRYGRAPANYREWTKQARGLQSRGFTAEQVRRVVPDIES